MQFSLSEEQSLIVETVRRFVAEELVPHEDEVERLNAVPRELTRQIGQRARAKGLSAINMPEDLGGGGLDAVAVTLVEIELGHTSFALQYAVQRPSNILRACKGWQIDRYLLPTIRGERVECLAMTEPDAGSDLRSMKTRARRDGADFIIDGIKHFISYADVADYAVVFAATGEEGGITSFLIDKGTPGFELRPGPECVSHRGFHHSELVFNECRLHESHILGEEHRGLDVARQWLGATRLTVAAQCVGRARRVLAMAAEWAANRRQFSRAIGRFQGTSFKLADMMTELEAAELLVLRAADRETRGVAGDRDFAMAKLYATEMLARVTDHAVQIFGGMGLMKGLAIERFWRDARVERIWDGTSEIQRHILSRSLLREFENSSRE